MDNHMDNHMHSDVYDDIIYPFINFGGCNVEVWELLSHHARFDR